MRERRNGEGENYRLGGTLAFEVEICGLYGNRNADFPKGDLIISLHNNDTFT